MLEKEGADPNRIVPSISNYSALHMAAMNWHPEVVTALLKAGANVNIRNEQNGTTPLALAVFHVAYGGSSCLRKRATFDALIAGGVDWEEESATCRYLLDSSYEHKRYIFLALLRAGATLNLTDYDRTKLDSRYLSSIWRLVKAVKKAGAFDEYARRQLEIHASILAKCRKRSLPADVTRLIAGYYMPRGGY